MFHLFLSLDHSWSLSNILCFQDKNYVLKGFDDKAIPDRDNISNVPWSLYFQENILLELSCALIP